MSCQMFEINSHQQWCGIPSLTPAVMQHESHASLGVGQKHWSRMELNRFRAIIPKILDTIFYFLMTLDPYQIPILALNHCLVSL